MEVKYSVTRPMMRPPQSPVQTQKNRCQFLTTRPLSSVKIPVNSAGRAHRLTASTACTYKAGWVESMYKRMAILFARTGHDVLCKGLIMPICVRLPV